jgi:hypothetical protein
MERNRLDGASCGIKTDKSPCDLDALEAPYDCVARHALVRRYGAEYRYKRPEPERIVIRYGDPWCAGLSVSRMMWLPT